MNDHSRQLAAVMFTDISGYTALMGRDERKALELLQTNRQIQKPLIEKYSGKWVKEMGDGTLSQFDSAYDAVKCAIEIQQRAKNELKAQLRIGLHLGEITIENEDIFGDGVNVASRIESIADPGSIYLSEAVHNALHNRPDIHTQYLGEVLLKNVDEPIKLYCVEGEGLTVPPKTKIKELREGLATEEPKIKQFFKHPLFTVLIVVLFIGILTIQNLKSLREKREIHSLAIIPTVNLTGSTDQQYFVDMMHDAVIGEISKIEKLIVISRTSTLQFRDTKLTIPEIAKILNVDAIIESSVTKTGDSVYIQVQLIRARPVEAHIWAQDYKRDTRHILSLYGDLAKAVAKEVNAQLSPFEEKRLTEKKEVDPEALKAYMMGRYHWTRLTKEDLDLAEKYYQKAIEIDPNYAEAYLALSNVGGGRGIMGLMSPEEIRLRYDKYAKKAYELDSGLWEAQSRNAMSLFWGGWEFKKALEVFETEIKLNPNEAVLRAYHAQALCIAIHDYDRAIKEGARAVEIDPLNNLWKGLYGQTLNYSRKYDEAEKIFKEVLDLDPYNAISLSNIKTTYHMQKKYEQAYEFWKIDNRKDSLAVKALESGYKKGGYSEALKTFTEYSIEKSKTEYVTPWRIFTLYARAGMKEESLDWLEKAYEIHDRNMPAVNTDPIFDYMRDEPRFQAIIKKMNFPGN